MFSIPPGTYLPRIVNVVCERLLIQGQLHIWTEHSHTDFCSVHICSCPCLRSLLQQKFLDDFVESIFIFEMKVMLAIWKDHQSVKYQKKYRYTCRLGQYQVRLEVHLQVRQTMMRYFFAKTFQPQADLSYTNNSINI